MSSYHERDPVDNLVPLYRSNIYVIGLYYYKSFYLNENKVTKEFDHNLIQHTLRKNQ